MGSHSTLRCLFSVLSMPKTKTFEHTLRPKSGQQTPSSAHHARVPRWRATKRYLTSKSEHSLRRSPCRREQRNQLHQWCHDLRRGDESQALPSLWLFFFPFWGTWGESNPGKSDPTVTKLPSGTWPSKICKKNTLITSLRLFFWPPRQAPPPTPPILTSFAKTTLPSLPAGFRNHVPSSNSRSPECTRCLWTQRTGGDRGASEQWHRLFSQIFPSLQAG